MDAKAEAKALEDAKRHAEEFRVKHSIPIEEWNLAEEMAEDIKKQLLDDFWKLWLEGK